MKSALKVTLSVAALAAVMIAFAPVAEAQCSPAQVFASVGLAKAGFSQVSVDATLVDDVNFVGQFWAGGNSNNANSDPNPNGSCPASLWWLSTMAGATRGISGAITSGGCFASSCPNPAAGGDTLRLVIEETSGGGVGANYRLWEVDGTPAATRIWDYGRVAPTGTTFVFTPFPKPIVTASARQPSPSTDVDIIFDAADPGLGYASAVGAGDTPIPSTVAIVGVDICTFHGPADPGRPRAAGWACGAPIAYNGANYVGVPFKVACPNDGADTWVALGLIFDGGTGPAVPSEYVGEAIQVECDPTIAEPEPDTRPRIRPKKPGRTPARR